MKVKSALLGLAAASGGLLMSANVASADGYSAPARSVAAPTWTGCYVGIAGGWAWGESKHKEQLISSTTATPVTVTTATIASFDLDGGLIGGTAGCNLQSSGGFVLGVESDLSWIDKKGSGLDDPAVGVTNNKTEERWLETTRLRLGWAAGNFLLYATGGAAFADAKYTACSAALGCESQSKWRVGLTYGGGAEWKFDRNWSAKIEYLHIDFENQQYLTPSALGFQNRAGGVSLNDDIVRFGINYKLDRREAVPLK
jgi:outer membrane immunogenic protein